MKISEAERKRRPLRIENEEAAERSRYTKELKEAAENAAKSAAAAKEAETGAAAALEAGMHLPLPSENGRWQVWDAAQGAYTDSGLSCRGVQGPSGEQGPHGEPGADGRDFTIRDIYPTLAALREDWPQGNEYAYQVTAENGEVFIWSEKAGDWASIGSVGGIPGTTFIPAVSADGTLSWTNDGGKQNPPSVNITGPAGRNGTVGPGLPAGGAAGQIPVKASAADYDTAWEYPQYCRRNLLDNGYFVGGGSQLGDGVFPINQRGQTSYSDIDIIDRWNVSAANRVNVELLTDAVRLTKSTSSAFRFRQYANSYDGQMTLSVLVKSATYSAGTVSLVAYSETGVIEQTAIPSSSAKQLISITFNAANLNHVAVTMTSAVPADSYVDVIAMKLELGSYQTLAHNEGTEAAPNWVLNEIPDFGEELRKCQRHYVRFSGKYITTGFVSSGAKRYYMPIYLPQPMDNPTVNMASWTGRLATGYCARTPDGTAKAPTTIGIYQKSQNFVCAYDDIGTAVDTNNSVINYMIDGLEVASD